MTTTRVKCIFSHIIHIGSRLNDMTHVILTLVFGLGFDHEEITETLQRFKLVKRHVRTWVMQSSFSVVCVVCL
jgi:hypothetical protein